MKINLLKKPIITTEQCKMTLKMKSGNDTWEFSKLLLDSEVTVLCNGLFIDKINTQINDDWIDLNITGRKYIQEMHSRMEAIG